MQRDHWMAIGTVVLLLGLTFQRVESFNLHHEVHHKIAEAMDEESPFRYSPRIVIPDWLRYAALSAGAVLLLHGVVLKKAAK